MIILYVILESNYPRIESKAYRIAATDGLGYAESILRAVIADTFPGGTGFALDEGAVYEYSGDVGFLESPAATERFRAIAGYPEIAARRPPPDWKPGRCEKCGRSAILDENKVCATGCEVTDEDA